MSLIRSLPLVPFLFLFGIFTAMVVLCVFVAIRTRTRASLIAATPTAHVGFATPGYLELEGRAEAANGLTLTTPLTGTACLWYHARLEQWRKDRSDDGHKWHQVHDITSAEPFLLRDGSGACIVFPWGAEVTFTDRSVWFGSTPEPEDKNPERRGPGEGAESNIHVHGPSGSEYRYTEERIYVGDPLYALGEFSTAAWDPDDWDEDEATDPGDPDPDAWEKFDRYNELSRNAAKLTSRRIGKAKSKPYLLSTTPQAKLLEVHSTGWRAVLFVAIVPAAIALGLLWLRFA